MKFQYKKIYPPGYRGNDHIQDLSRSVTNAIRHGQAKTVNIIIKGHSKGIRLYIIDDGKGCRDLVKGYGLTGMEERIAKLGGNITFGSDGEKGFNIIANLPV